MPHSDRSNSLPCVDVLLSPIPDSYGVWERCVARAAACPVTGLKGLED
jgi:hypothetical protein